MDPMAGFWLGDGPGNPDKYTEGLKTQARSLASRRHHHQHYHEDQDSPSCILLFYFACITNNHRLLAGILVVLFCKNSVKSLTRCCHFHTVSFPLNIRVLWLRRFLGLETILHLSNFLWWEWKDFPNLFWGFLYSGDENLMNNITKFLYVLTLLIVSAWRAPESQERMA